MDSTPRDTATTAAVSFVAGVVSASLLWWTFNQHSKTKEGWMDSVKHRIGELPSKMESKLGQKTRWPWDKIKRTVSSWAPHAEETSTKQQGSDKANTAAGATTHNPATFSQDENPEFVEEKKSDLCIGSIFGLDVGGTLAKLVYFEQQNVPYNHNNTSMREMHYHQAASATAVLQARRTTSYDDFSNHGSMESMFDETQQRRKSVMQIKTHHGDEASQEDLQSLYRMRQESVPDNLDKYAESCHFAETNVTTSQSIRNVVLGDLCQEENDEADYPHFGTSMPQPPPQAPATAPSSPETKNDLDNSTLSETMTFQIRRSRSMFDLSKSRDYGKALDRFYNFARRLDTYETGVKDKHLSFFSRELGGDFHFIRFETRRMENAMDLIRVNNLHLNIQEMGATGGGAHKFAAAWKSVLGIDMCKQDELDSLVAGMQFVLATVVGECYTFRPKLHNATQEQNNENDDNRQENDERERSRESSISSGGDMSSNESSRHSGSEQEAADAGNQGRVDEWWWSRKVQRDLVMGSSAYPYLVVTIGTGVSILRVDGPRKHERISGSTIGGGTYWGLIRLLTDVDDFEDVMKLAEKGDPSKVDMMVGDIYGPNSDALEKIGLSSDLVASSFGKLVAKQDPASGIKQEDLARALLLMVTINIGQVAYLNAQLHQTRRIYFVGNFLRNNHLSQRRLSFAIDYWSKGEMEALFLEHEGYFGAVGAFLLSQGISHGDQGFFQWEPSSSKNATAGTAHAYAPSAQSGDPIHRRRSSADVISGRSGSDTLLHPSEEAVSERRRRTMSES